jgi:rare lipoprotein A (peptidoglycan hydrolase)
VTPSVLQRTVWLAAVTLVGAVVAVAITHAGTPKKKELPGAVVVPGSVNGWYVARAAPYAPTESRQRTACGQQFTAKTKGVAHPVLPCGVKIYLSFGGKEVLTQVIDRGPNVPGRTFDVSKALADTIGLHGTQKIRWRFAR